MDTLLFWEGGKNPPVSLFEEARKISKWRDFIVFFNQADTSWCMIYVRSAAECGEIWGSTVTYEQSLFKLLQS